MIEWLTNHWVEISAAFAALIVAADKVAKLTPTNKDNDIIDAIKRLIARKP